MYPFRLALSALMAFLYACFAWHAHGQAAAERLHHGSTTEWLLLNMSGIQGVSDESVVSVPEPHEGAIFITPSNDTLRWQNHESLYSIVNLSKTVPAGSKAYAFTSIRQEVSGSKLFRFGSKGLARVWINGQLVFNQEIKGSASLDKNVLIADLKPGKNTVLVYVEGWDGDLDFSLSNVHEKDNLVYGIVTYDSGEPASEVEIEIICGQNSVSQTNTSHQGMYAIKIPESTSGCYLKASGAEQGAWEVVSPNHQREHNELNVRLRPVSSLSGVLYHQDGTTPEAGVFVEAIRKKDNLLGATGFSNQQGLFKLENLPEGIYTLRIRLPGGAAIYSEDQPVFSANALLNANDNKSLSNVEFKLPRLRKGEWTNYSTLDGLPYNIVTDLFVDSDGYLICAVFGGGVCKFDGHAFERVSINQDLVYDTAQEIMKSSDGSLWIGTDKGVARQKEDSVQVWSFEGGVINNNVQTVFEDSEGRIWIGTAGGLYLFEDGKFSPVNAFNELAPLLFTNDIEEDGEGRLWIGTRGGLLFFDDESFSVSDLFLGEDIEDILLAEDNAIWLATHNGVVRVKEDEVKRWTTKNGLVHNMVYEVCESNHGLMWFGTERGISSFDGNLFVNYTSQNGLTNNQIHSLECSDPKILWAGTENGLSRLDYSINNFGRKEGLLKFDNQLAGVFDIEKVSADEIYISTDWQGVLGFDGSNLKPIPGLESELYVREMLKMKSGAYLLGSNAGLITIDPKLPDVSPVFWGNDTWSLALEEDDAGNIWVGQGWSGGGLFKYDPETGQLLKNYTLADGLPDENVWSITHVPGQGLWIGTSSGIALLDDGEIKDIQSELGIKPASIYASMKDSEGNIWFGSSNGIYRYSGETWNHYTQDGIYTIVGESRELVSASLKLPEEDIWSLHQSSDGVMWFGTQSRGLVGYDGVTYSIIDARQGLPGNHVMAISSDPGGEMWIGTLDGGLTQLHRKKRFHPVVILSVSNGSESFSVHEPKPAFISDEVITLSYNEVDLNSHADNGQFLITIKNLKRNSSTHFVTKERDFDWVPEKAGKYVVQVQYVDPYLNYSPASTVALRVRLSLAKNPVFVIPVVLGLLGIIAYSVAVNFRYMQQKKRAREIEREMLAKELEAKKRLEFKNQELEGTNKQLSYLNDELNETNDKLKEQSDQLREALETNKEIIGITAHDLKNPLGGIIGLAEIVLMDSEEETSIAMSSVRENVPQLKQEAERMLHIIKELLDKHREDGKPALKKEKVILNDIVATVVRWNNTQATNKDIALHFETCSTVIVEADLVAIQRALDNYVSNAIKYSPTGKNVWIKVQKIKDSEGTGTNKVKVSVRDEGPGLTDTDKAKVFGKMQRLSAKPTAGEHSTGLGLFIVKSFVEAHGGAVGVESKANEGATFWFTLPLSEELMEFDIPMHIDALN